MSLEATALIGQVSDVQPHPSSDNLDIVTIAGKTNVANRPASNRPRYVVGDYAVVLAEGLILPDALIKHLDMWNHSKNKGGLGGNKGNRTKARNIGGVPSEVALCAVLYDDCQHEIFIPGLEIALALRSNAIVGFDMTDVLGIVPYVPA